MSEIDEARVRRYAEAITGAAQVGHWGVLTARSQAYWLDVARRVIAVADEEQAALRKGLETEVREGTAERLAQWHRAEAAEAKVGRLRHHERFLAAAIVQIAEALGAEIDTNLTSPEVLLLAEQTAEEARNANAELADARERLRRCEERLAAVEAAAQGAGLHGIVRLVRGERHD